MKSSAGATATRLPALSFIGGYGYPRFIADGDPRQVPEHLNFGLSGDQGVIGLYNPDLTPDRPGHLSGAVAQRLAGAQPQWRD